MNITGTGAAFAGHGFLFLMNRRRFRVSPRRLPTLLAFVSSVALGSTLLLGAPSVRADVLNSNFTPAPLFSRSDITFRTLPNGVRVILKRASAPDQVCVQIWVRSGSRYEANGESGAAHLLELAATRGSKNYPTTDDSDEGGLNGAIRTLGGDTGSLTSRDATFYSATVAKPYWSRALSALSDAVLNPTLTEDAIDEARSSAYGDLTQRLINPVSYASDLAYANAFTKHPYRNSAIGSQASLSALNSKKVRAFHQRQYVGKNITLVIVGDVAPASGLEAARRALGAASAQPAPPLKLTVEPALKSKETTRRTPTLTGATALAWRSPGITNPSDVLAFDTLLSLWREGLDSNLRRLLLRDGADGSRKPLVGAFDVDFLTQRDPGLFIVDFTGYSDPAEAVDVVLKEVKRVQDEGVSPEELARAKAQLRSQYIEQSENVAGQAGALGFYDTIDSYNYAVDYLARASRVTAADLQRVARQYLKSDAMVRAEIQAMHLPKPNQGDDLSNDTIEVRAPSKSRWAQLPHLEARP